MFRGKTLKIYDRNTRLLLSILTQWHYSVFKTKIYLPRKCLSNSQEGHTVITWRVQSRRVKTSIRPSLGTFHCQLSHCKVSIVHQTSVPYSFLLWLHQHWEQNCLLCIEYFHTSRGSPQLPGFISRHCVVFGAGNDLVIQTEHVSFDPMWLVTQHHFSFICRNLENSSSAHRYLLRHYWLTDTYM